MVQQVTFTVLARSLKKGLDLMTNPKSRFHKHVELRISVLPDAIELFGLGGSFRIKAQTYGLADVSIPGRIIQAYLQTFKGKEISFAVKPGEVQCGASIFSTPEITIEGFLTTKDSLLPVNASDLNVLRVCNNRSQEWLKDYSLDDMYDSAKRRLSANITEALIHLSEYGVNREDLKILVQGKIEHSD